MAWDDNTDCDDVNKKDEKCNDNDTTSDKSNGDNYDYHNDDKN